MLYFLFFCHTRVPPTPVIITPGIKTPGIPGAIPVMTSPVMPSPSRPALAKLMFLYRVFFSAPPRPPLFGSQKGT